MAETTSSTEDNAIQFQNSTEVISQPLSIEHYFPKNFPKYLFQGTSTSNSDTVKEIGLRGGSLITDIGGCMDSRFYRGRFLISKYDDSIFEPQVEEYVQYEIKQGTASLEEANRIFPFNAVDTDGAEARVEASSSRLHEKENLASFDLSIQQRIYIQMIAQLIRGNLCGTTSPEVLEAITSFGLSAEWNQVDVPFPSDGTMMKLGGGSISRGDTIYGKYMNGYPMRKGMSEFLNIHIDEFSNQERLREALSSLGEEVLIARLIQNFPGEVEVDWNNLDIDKEALVKEIIESLYKTHLVRSVKNVYHQTKVDPSKIIFAQGDSSKGLEELIDMKSRNAVVAN